MGIHITLYSSIIDIDDAEIGRMVEEDYRFIIKGLPEEKHQQFWATIAASPHLSERNEQGKDGRLRVDWNHHERDERAARVRLSAIIKELYPNAKICYSRLGNSLIEDFSDYDDGDELSLIGGFTDEERTCLPEEERAAILGIHKR